MVQEAVRAADAPHDPAYEVSASSLSNLAIRHRGICRFARVLCRFALASTRFAGLSGRNQLDREAGDEHKREGNGPAVSCSYKKPSAGINVSCYQPSIQHVLVKVHHSMNRSNSTCAEVRCRCMSPAIIANVTLYGLLGSWSHLQV